MVETHFYCAFCAQDAQEVYKKSLTGAGASSIIRQGKETGQRTTGGQADAAQFS